MGNRVVDSDLVQEFKYGLRQIRRSPGFFAVAALLVAVGVAASTEIFTLVDALLLRPLPVKDPQNLVQLFEQQAKRPADPFFDYGFYTRLARYSATLFQVTGQVETTRSLETNGGAERIWAVAVTGDFFANLGVNPLLGRMLTNGDDHAVVLSYKCWSRSFGRTANVLGRTIHLQGHPFTVIGVAPRKFSGTMPDSSPDLWMPFKNIRDFARTPQPDFSNYVIEIIARLRPGVSTAQAQGESAALWSRYLKETGADADYGLNRGELQVRSITRGVSPLRNQARNALILLLSGTGLLMLMVCSNVGALLLSRAVARERETAVRVALGASRWRIVYRWLVESLLLTTVGGATGLLLAYALMPLLMRWMPPAHGIGFDPSEARTLDLYLVPDLRIAAFSLVICGLTAALCAVAPAMRSLSADINAALKSTMGDHRTRLLQLALCGVQIALCTALVASAGLIIRSLEKLRASNTGFERDHVTVFSIDPRVRGYNSQQTWSLEQRLMSSVRDLPGVEGVALAQQALMHGIGLGTSVVFPGQTGGVINSSINQVTPEYFDVMGIRLLGGRAFQEGERAEEGRLAKVVANEAFVRKFLNGRSPIGQQFDIGKRFNKPRYEIIGVVSDTKYRSLRESPPPIYYTYDFGPNAYPASFILHVRSQGDPRAVIEPVERLLKSMDPALPVYQVATLSEEVDRSLWQERLVARLTSCFGGFALLLSAMGIYGVLAFFVARRQREIGIRMALGADAREVIRLVVSRVLPVLGIGIAAGATLSWLAGEWARGLLYEVRPFDLAAQIPAIVLLVSTAAIGAAIPAFRAMRLDPASALRQD